MTIFNHIFLQLGIPAVIGMVLGVWLFASDVRGNGRNIFGMTPWNPIQSALLGGVVFGGIIWFLIGVLVGLQTGAQ